MAENRNGAAPGAPSQIGRYRVFGVAGEWARGWLYRGRDDIVGRDVLIKTLSVEAARDSAARGRFQREASVVARLRHPNIIRILDLGEHQGIPFMALEALEGQSLSERMNHGITLKNGLLVVLQILDGLACMHAGSIIHRDINPDCIFVCTDGRAKVADLWLAKITDLARHDTRAGVILAASPYMAPEQVRGVEADGRSDLFGVGSVLYRMVTGHEPFGGISIAEMFVKILTEELDAGRIPSGPQWEPLRSVMRRALQKTPGARYPDARTMHADLALALKELGDNADWTPPWSEAMPRLSLGDMCPTDSKGAR